MERARMIGNAFHYELVRTIFSEMMFVPTEGMMRKVEMYKVETQRMNGGSCTVANEGREQRHQCQALTRSIYQV